MRAKPPYAGGLSQLGVRALSPTHGMSNVGTNPNVHFLEHVYRGGPGNAGKQRSPVLAEPGLANGSRRCLEPIDAPRREAASTPGVPRVGVSRHSANRVRFSDLSHVAPDCSLGDGSATPGWWSPGDAFARRASTSC